MKPRRSRRGFFYDCAMDGMNILSAIGDTKMVRIRGVFAKLEFQNPTGSMKDRMAEAVIARAEERGHLNPGGRVVEYTGGSTGASLALVCAAKGYPIRIVTSDAFAREKLDQMAAYGAQLTIVKSEDGRTTKALILEMIEVARKIAQEPDTYWTNQLENADTITGYYKLADEIIDQCGGRVDAFVHSVGTAASLRGVATVLKRHNPNVRIVAVEPAESPVLSGGQPGPHKIEGVGVGFMPPLWDASLVDDIIPIATDDAKEMARRLAREDGVFAGTSSGANMVAAMRVRDQLGHDANVATLIVDSGLKYVNTDVYRKP